MACEVKEEWVHIQQPGYLGRHRNEREAEWTAHYGKGNWRLDWLYEEQFIDFLAACALYEESYFRFLSEHTDILEILVSEAKDVYDDAISNICSGMDYTKQETDRTHIQDIAIRRSVYRLGKRFMGVDYIQIRQEKGDHPLSMILSPGKVPFFNPQQICQPEIHGWWDSGTIESFYQTNRYLRIRA